MYQVFNQDIQKKKKKIHLLSLDSPTFADPSFVMKNLNHLIFWQILETPSPFKQGGRSSHYSYAWSLLPVSIFFKSPNNKKLLKKLLTL